MAIEENKPIYEQYRAETIADVKDRLEHMGCQPILFVGSGLSRRYLGTPSWDGLLEAVVERCPTLIHPYAYYRQKSVSLIDVGTALVDPYREWAWSTGKNSFPSNLFDKTIPVDSYLKHTACEIISDISSKAFKDLARSKYQDEILSLKNLEPHAIITTNYDELLEHLFPDFTPIVGQEILRENNISVGEIFKIHGSINTPTSVVLTREDYDFWQKRKKYLSAKLLTYFLEHPLLVVGYSAHDPNIRSILQDIDEIVGEPGALTQNIYILEWQEFLSDTIKPAREKLIDLGEGKSIRVKLIVASDFKWVFEAFGIKSALSRVDPRKLRALVARTYDLVRRDLPKRTVEVNFDMLENAISSSVELAKLYGISTIDDPTVLNAGWPHTLTSVGKAIGGVGWHEADRLLRLAKDKSGIDLKESDNKYHVSIKTGTKDKSISHKYSNCTIDLLHKIKKNQPWEINI